MCLGSFATAEEEAAALLAVAKQASALPKRKRPAMIEEARQQAEARRVVADQAEAEKAAADKAVREARWVARGRWWVAADQAEEVAKEVAKEVAAKKVVAEKRKRPATSEEARQQAEAEHFFLQCWR